MHKPIKHNKIVAFWLALCMILSFVPMGVSGEETTERFPDGLLELSGFEVQAGQNGYIQALVTVKLKYATAAGVSVVLNYNPDIMIPSNFETNEELTEKNDFELVESTPAFKISAGLKDKISRYADAFSNRITQNYFGEGAKADWNRVSFYILPSQDVTADGTYLVQEQRDDRDELGKNAPWNVFKAYDPDNTSEEKNSLEIGQISFWIKDPQAFSALGNLDEIEQNAIELATTTENGITKSDTSYAYLAPNEFNMRRPEDEKSLSHIKFRVERIILNINPKDEEITASSFDVYTDGGQTATYKDIIGYLNKYHQTVIARWSDNVFASEEMEWRETNDAEKEGYSVNFSIKKFDSGGNEITDWNKDTGYDPRGSDGGYYLITQKYNSLYEVSIKVRVTPVYLTGFSAEPQSKMLIAGSPERNITWADLDMPSYAEPIVSEEIDRFVPPKVELTQTSWSPDDVTETLKTGTAVAEQKYDYTVKIEDATIGEQKFTDALPWLTEKEAAYDISVIRQAGDTEDDKSYPKNEEEAKTGYSIKASVDQNGVMTVTVENPSGEDIADTTNFKIYLPNGMVLDTANGGGIVTKTIKDGKAVITINTKGEGEKSYTDEQLKAIQSVINLPSDDYNLTATEENKGESEKTKFSSDGRENYYSTELIDENQDSKDRYFELADYSVDAGLSGLFEIYPGQSIDTISTYIEFPDSKTIPVAFDGESGVEGAVLGAAKVKGWTLEKADGKAIESGIFPDKRTTVYLVGLLDDYSYTNMGKVKNPNNIYLKLKLTVKDTDETYDGNHSIKVTTPVAGTKSFELTENAVYNFDTQQVFTRADTGDQGYDTAQATEFFIENNGTTNISGLSVSIDSEDFILESEPTPSNLAKSGTDKSRFVIRTKVGLEAGTYEATVTVSSNNISSAEGAPEDGALRHFKLRFVVTDEPVYRVNIHSRADSDNFVEDNTSQGVAYLVVGDSETGTTELASSTFINGQRVNIKAEAVKDRSFTNFENREGYRTELNDTQAPHLVLTKDTTGKFNVAAETWFNVNSNQLNADGEIDIYAYFMEEVQAKLIIEDLKDYDNTDESRNLWVDNNGTITKVDSFASYNEDYDTFIVYIPNEMNLNHLEFKPKNIDIGGVPIDVTVTVTPPLGETFTYTNSQDDDADSDTLLTYDDQTGIYKTPRFELLMKDDDTQPDYNLTTVKITQQYNTDSRSYTVKIYRKPEVHRTMKYGNSPMGLIMNDTEHGDTTEWSEIETKLIAEAQATAEPSESPEASAEPSESPEASAEPSESPETTAEPSESPEATEEPDNRTWKEKAASNFIKNHTFGDYVPDKAGYTTSTYYSTEAWNNDTNYDEDPYALFVYEGEEFVDPGYTDLKMTDGSTRATNSLKRYLAPEVMPAYDTSKGLIENLTGDAVSTSEIPLDYNVELPNDSIKITTLKDLRIRPGVYRLVYRFLDSDDQMAEFSRHVVILPRKGDFNVNNTTYEATDYTPLYERFNAEITDESGGHGVLNTIIYNDKTLLTETKLWQTLLTYRVADVNEDRNANTTDAQAIQSRTKIAQRQYYVPLSTASTVNPIQTTTDVELQPPQITPPADPEQKAQISIKSLALNADAPGTEEHSGAITEADWAVKGDKTMKWFGIVLNNAYNLKDGLLKDGIKNFEIAVDYDSDYFEPCGPQGSTTDTTNNVGTVVSTAKQNWLNLIEEVSVASASDAVHSGYVSDSFWDADMYDIDIDAASQDYTIPYETDYANDYEKSSLTSEVTDKNSTSIKTVYIQIKAKDTASAYRLNGDEIEKDKEKDKDKEYYLLRMPFRVKKPVPEGTYVDLHMSPQTFSIGTASTETDETTDAGSYVYTSWERADKTNANINLKNYIDAANANSDYLTSLELWGYYDPAKKPYYENEYYENTSEDNVEPELSTPEPISIYTLGDLEYIDNDSNKTSTSFSPKDRIYYASVPSEINMLSFKIKPANKVVSVQLGLETTAPQKEKKKAEASPTPTATAEPTASPEATESQEPLVTIEDYDEYRYKVYTDELTTIPRTDEPEDETIYETQAALLTRVNEDVLSLVTNDVNENELGYGYSNVFVINLDNGSNPYYIFVRRLQKPRIQLPYGNTPKGLIWRDDDTFPTLESKQAALKAFDKPKTRKKFAAGMVPIIRYDADTNGKKTIPVYANQDLEYTKKAWDSYDGYNYDTEDEYAYGVYNGSRVKLPEGNVINELGITLAEANRSLSMDSFGTGGLPTYDDTQDNIKVLTLKNIKVIKNDKKRYNFLNTNIRPGIYTMEYNYSYPLSGGTTLPLYKKRDIIFLNYYGDVSMNNLNQVLYADFSVVLKQYDLISDTKKYNSLFAYRIADVRQLTSITINNSDYNYLFENENMTLLNEKKEYYRFYPDILD